MVGRPEASVDPGARTPARTRRLDGAGRVDVSTTAGVTSKDQLIRGGLMVCGTTSDAGKSHVTSGLCRLLARRGVRVAPFKAQNMALNSFVTADGHEIGRAQAVQAWAARVEPEVAMNPILLKPSDDRSSQVIVMGKSIGQFDAVAYHELKPTLLNTVMAALCDLRSRFDVVILEGAGSPAEINLLEHDIVNLRVAHDADLQAIIVGDIDRGGVFASLFGTVALLPDHYRSRIGGFVINKFRGDPALLAGASEHLERRCGVPTLGVVPFIDDVSLDAEDSLALAGPRPRALANGKSIKDSLEVVAIRFPHLSNVTDLDALAIEPGVSVRLVDAPGQIGHPDLVILPGTKATVADLNWMRTRGFEKAIEASGALVLGICGGYQMMGSQIVDDVESCAGKVDGLGWLDVETEFSIEKLTVQRKAIVMGEPASGYEIHHGVVTRGPGAYGWIHIQGETEDGNEDEGAIDGIEARYMGTSLHGLFESDRFRSTFLIETARRVDKCFVPQGVSFRKARDSQIDRIADALSKHLDLDAIDVLIAKGALR